MTAFAVTRRVLGLLMHPKYNFFRGSTQDPAGGAYSAPPDPLAGGEGARCPLPRSRPSASNSGPSGLKSQECPSKDKFLATPIWQT